MLLNKLNHYEISGVSNNWFKSYLFNCNQYVSANGYHSGLAAINCGVPKESILGPLPFLLYISEVHHFADDTSLLYLSNSILKHQVNCLNANEILVSIKRKTEMVIFKSNQKRFAGDLKMKFCGKRLYPTESVKFFVVKNNANLSSQYHVNDISIKLNRANALLFKMRKYVSFKTLRSICFAILIPTHPTSFLSGIKTVAILNGF